METKSIVLGIALLATTTANAQNLTLKANNIDKIVAAMTLEEKAHLLVGNHDCTFNGFESRRKQLKNDVQGAAGTTSAIPRLGIPNTILSDGPAGVRIDPRRDGDPRTYFATAFPIGTAIASTWNLDLVRQIGQAMGNEVLEYGVDVLLAPGMNIHRNPLCGRTFEYYSEDPVVAGLTAAAMVNGVQSMGVGTSIKHFAVNSQETNRLEVDEVVSKRALREIYLKPFELAVKLANPWTVMSSYNRLNGPYTQEDYELLTTVLRDEWGFKGIVMTDWTGPRTTAAQIHAGNDVLCPGDDKHVADIISDVKSGRLSMGDVDKAVKRMLQYIVRTPHFRGYAFSNNPELAEHAAITRQSATEGMVLLKNSANTLPMSGVKTVALFGSQSYAFMSCGLGSGCVNTKHVVDMVEGLKNAGIAITPDMEAVYRKYFDFVEMRHKLENPNDFDWAVGRSQYPNFGLAWGAIENQAKKADIAIVTIGHQTGEGRDRRIEGEQGFKLTADEMELLRNVSKAFHQQNKKMVVVLNSGNVMETASWRNLADAILVAWQPGQEGGNSVADILTGKANPSGKLTMTWPMDVMDVPSSHNFPLGDGKNEQTALHKEGINIGYRYFNTAHKEVAYPFGFGLSYTTFAYSAPKVKSTKNGFRASITVTNTGKVEGKEAVQLYVSAPKGKLEKPECELKAFAKTRNLKPGEQQTLYFDVTNYGLASFDEAANQWISDAGTYTLKFGANVEDIRSTATYRLGKVFTKKVNDVLNPNHTL